MPAEISISKRQGKAKIKVSHKRQSLKERMSGLEAEDLDVSLGLIQELIPLAVREVEYKLKEEVAKIVGIGIFLPD